MGHIGWTNAEQAGHVAKIVGQPSSGSYLMTSRSSDIDSVHVGHRPSESAGSTPGSDPLMERQTDVIHKFNTSFPLESSHEWCQIYQSYIMKQIANGTD